jgi:hypothetical protein
MSHRPGGKTVVKVMFDVDFMKHYLVRETINESSIVPESKIISE